MLALVKVLNEKILIISDIILLETVTGNTFVEI